MVNQQDRFERDVVRPFVERVSFRTTPIPCSLCNNHLKFDQLLIVARQIGADRWLPATTRRCEFDPDVGRWLLKRPADRSKDQTYFLFGLTQDQLSRTLFPLGGMMKPEVRELARSTAWLSPRSRTRRRFALFRAATTSVSSTPILTSRARALPDTAANWSRPMAHVVGEHGGIHNFTVGQRKGLGGRHRLAALRDSDQGMTCAR